MKNGTYYFWKWAENDLPGNPLEVQKTLLAGGMHPALQTFDARPLLERLDGAAKAGRPIGKEWDWEAVPKSAPDKARFVFVNCPHLKSSVARLRWFMDVFFPLRLSGFDEQTGQLIPLVPPKINCFVNGQTPEDRAYDIQESDLPRLLKGLTPRKSSAFASFEDRHSRVVRCDARGRRFRVEWRENYGALEDPPNWERYNHWRAHRNIPYAKNPDLLLSADALAIFRAFLNGKPRPAEYHWMDVKGWMDEHE